MNPLLALQIAEHAREEVRQHPVRWGCIALLAIIGPVLACVLVVLLFLMVIPSGAGGASSGMPAHVPGIPDAMLTAYARAVHDIAGLRPQCRGMRWSILAGIAQEESQHAAGHTIAANGDVSPPILGPPLDGGGVGGNRTPIRNPDGSFARAEGPFQFLSTTWAIVAQDGNGDGVSNPHNAFDAALAAAVYLCGPGARDLTDEAQLRAAIHAYNASQLYVDKVIANIRLYDGYRTHPASPGAINATGAAKTVIDAAMSQLGVPYAWGGGTSAGPSRGVHDGGVADAHGDYNKIGFDCSGLTLYAYAKVGIILPHNTRVQFNTGRRIPKEAGLTALQPGDLVFYSPDLIHHVGIYLGGNQIVNAPYSGSVVRIDSIDVSEYAGGAALVIH